MVAADYGRALLIVTVPVAAALGVLRMEQLYAVAFGVGTLSLLFAVASQSMLPLLVGRNALVEANSKLTIGRSGSEVVGPSVAGALVHLATAPAALAVDAATFVVSALSIHSIRAVEPKPQSARDRGGPIDEAREGFSLIARNRALLALGGLIGTLAICNAMFEAVWILYVSQGLDLSASALGILFSVGGVGFVIGASIADRVVRKIGLGPTILLGALLAGVSDLATPLAGGPLVAIFVTLIPAMLGFGIGATVYSVGQMSLRQATTPAQLLGRMNAVMNLLAVGLVPIGALMGGVLGEAIGLRTTLFIAVAGELSAGLWLVFSPVLSMRGLPGEGPP